jgi:hypothetical protein
MSELASDSGDESIGTPDALSSLQVRHLRGHPGAKPLIILTKGNGGQQPAFYGFVLPTSILASGRSENGKCTFQMTVTGRSAHRLGTSKMTRFNIPTTLTAVSAVFLFVGSAAQAEMMKFTAELTGAAQVPPADSAATGTVEVSLDTEAKTVDWVVTTEGLTGEPTASHIHGPAAATESAGPVIDTLATMEGSAPITDEQITDLTSGMYYHNVHTEKFPDGEIRGQLMVAK